MIEALFVIAIVAAGVGLYLRKTRGFPSKPLRRMTRARRGRIAERALLQMCRGDEAHVERLIAAERRRKPDGDRARWAVAAHKRWLADLR